LTKKEVTADVPFAVRMLYSYHTAKMGSKYQEFEARTTKELPQEQQTKRKKMIQKRIEKQSQMISADAS
jgi:hypothetical protein